jgi:predicted GIY-YIG superfamily endonuclease
VRVLPGFGEACPAELIAETKQGAQRNGARAMFYVYIIRSQNQPDQTYVGFTRNLKQRLLMHNQGRSPHTAKFSPWQIEFYCAFKQEDKALAFERYLKSHSGKAFAGKRLL